jgi:ribosomal protein S18 acetylase RimI-like enzyme
MSNFKLLIDTNIIIGLEDSQPVQTSFAELLRRTAEYGGSIFVDGANYDDVSRDRNASRKAVTLSKLAKFQKLNATPFSGSAQLAARYGEIKSVNDECDARLLAALDANAADFLITEDSELRKRAGRSGLGSRTLNVHDALAWLTQTYQEQAVTLPYVVERKAYELDESDPLFVSLREDYDGFDDWFARCRSEHRACWALEIGSQLAGLIIRKDESADQAKTKHRGPKILKLCTFKVRDEFRGEKFGELLLKQSLWFAQRNGYDVVYLTAFPKQTLLIELLSYYGFHETISLANGELTFEKPLLKGACPTRVPDALDFDRLNYPRACDGPEIRKFCVPIRPDYHRRLFPEIAVGVELPLFPDSRFVLPSGLHGDARRPGNTIRKVYLCGSKIARLRPGDILLFYMSKDPGYANSQSITTIGVVERVLNVTNTDDLVRLTAKRSVFSAAALAAMLASPHAPVKLIDFLLVNHVDPPIGVDQLIKLGAFVRPPQSIAEWTELQYDSVRPFLQL